MVKESRKILPNIKYKYIRKRIIQYKINKGNDCITDCPDGYELKVGSHDCLRCKKFISEKNCTKSGGTVICFED